MKNIQTLNINSSKSGKIALFISCEKCKTGRIYLIEESLLSLQNKKLSAFSTEVECAKCKNIIFVGIGYVENASKYSYKTPDFFGKEGFQVCDDKGLEELE